MRKQKLINNKKYTSIDIYSKEPNSPKIGKINNFEVLFNGTYYLLDVKFLMLSTKNIPEIFKNKYIYRGEQIEPIQIQVNYNDKIILFDNCWLKFFSFAYYTNDCVILDEARFISEQVKEVNMPKGQEKENKKNKKKLTTKEKQEKKKQKKEKQ